MIDHITLRVSNIEKTKEFYSKALEPLGYKLTCNETFEENLSSKLLWGFRP